MNQITIATSLDIIEKETGFDEVFLKVRIPGPDGVRLVNLSLKKIAMSNHIFGSDCPICGGKRSFFLWDDRHYVRCFDCHFGKSIE